MKVGMVDQLRTNVLSTEQTKGEFISLEHASRWLGQSVGIPGRDKSFG
ncbi:hypothetical protein Hanom_Chr11g01004871 [Helianthus anomalus]